MSWAYREKPPKNTWRARSSIAEILRATEGAMKL